MKTIYRKAIRERKHIPAVTQYLQINVFSSIGVMIGCVRLFALVGLCLCFYIQRM